MFMLFFIVFEYFWNKIAKNMALFYDFVILLLLLPVGLLFF